MDARNTVTPPRTTVRIWTLKDWEGSWPVCTNPTCTNEIRNGDQYIVIPGSVRILCSACMLSLPEWHASITVSADQERVRANNAAREQAKRARRENMARARLSRNPVQVYEPVVAECPICHKEFVASSHGKRGRQKYCSRNCVSRRNAREPRPCPVCGRIFTPDCAQTVCTTTCARARQRGLTLLTPPPKPWSQKYPACRGCKTTRRIHVAKGYCQQCYKRHIRDTPTPIRRKSSVRGSKNSPSETRDSSVRDH